MSAAVQPLNPSPPPANAGRRRLLMALGLCGLGVAACLTVDGVLRPNDGLLAQIRQWRGGHRPWPADGDAGVAASDRGKLALFVLAGQSNMSGRGRVDSGVKISTRPVYVFGNDDRWHRAIEPVDNGWEQVDRVSLDVVVGVGPGQRFGERWSELNAGQPVGLIPCAMGGSTIENWQRDERASALYGSMLRRCRAAAAEGEIRGVLFFQGESDAVGDRGERWGELFL
ncbi:MAG TPA: sialate O-acetylesterase, partial [Caulifigura sp.]|nr:sialate O-acetylesterase [Caulifigura sp.]